MSDRKNKYDVIVVGAGIAGLGVAAILSKEAGQKILVLDRFPMFGGRMMSYEGYPAKGWRTEIGLHMVELGEKASCTELNARVGKKVEWARFSETVDIWNGEKFINVAELVPLTKDDKKAFAEMLVGISKMTDAEIEAWDNRSLEEWLMENIPQPAVRELFTDLGMIMTTIPHAIDMAAGEGARQGGNHLCGAGDGIINRLPEPDMGDRRQGEDVRHRVVGADGAHFVHAGQLHEVRKIIVGRGEERRRHARGGACRVMNAPEDSLVGLDRSIGRDRQPEAHGVRHVILLVKERDLFQIIHALDIGGLDSPFLEFFAVKGAVLFEQRHLMPELLVLHRPDLILGFVQELPKLAYDLRFSRILCHGDFPPYLYGLFLSIFVTIGSIRSMTITGHNILLRISFMISVVPPPMLRMRESR